MSNMDADKFIAAWVERKLGRKKQHGSHYVIKNKDVEFLCHYTKTDTAPHILAMRCLKSGIVVRGNRGPKVTKDSPYYMVSFEKLTGLSSDSLHETRLVDYDVVKTESGPITRCLYDADGFKFYTEYEKSYFTGTQEYLDGIYSLHEKTTLTLYPTAGQCTKVNEARYYSMPHEIRDSSKVKVLNNFFLHPMPGLELALSDNIWATARWEPTILGWNVPAELVDSNGRLQYTWREDYKPRAKFIEEMKRRGEAGRNAIAWREKHDAWEAACEKIKEVSDLDTYSRDIETTAQNSWKDESGEYLRGVVETPRNPHSLRMELGDTWHKIYDRKGKQHYYSLRGFLPPLQRKPRTAISLPNSRYREHRKAQKYWYCPTFLTKDPNVNTKALHMIVDIGPKEDPTVGIVETNHYGDVRDETVHRVMWEDLRKAG